MHSVDGTSHTLTITITGTNDVPVLTGQTQSVTEDGAQLTGRMVATDVDKDDTQAFSIANPVPGFTLNADGSYTFDPTDAAYQHIQAGHSETVTIPVTVTDSAGATATQNLVITVAGAQDGAVISGASSGAVTEDTALTTGHFLSTSGQLSVTDADAGEAAFQVATLKGSEGGELAIDAAGAWHYKIDNSLSAVQQLGPQGALSETFTVHAADGTSQQIAITVHGTIDAPTLSATQEATHFVPTDATAEVVNRHGVFQQVTLTGYATDQIEQGGKLNLNLAATAQVSDTPDFGVVSVTGGTSAQTQDRQLEKGETLLIRLGGAARTASLQLGSFMDHTTYTSVSEDKAHWVAYDAQGNKVGEGDLLPNVDPALNGRLDIHTATPFSFIALQAVDAPVHDLGSHISRFTLERVEAQLIQFDTRLNLAGQLTDHAASESLSFRISGLDAAASLNHGTRNADGSWTVTAAEAQDLHLLHATDQHLEVVAVAADGNARAGSQPFALTVTSSGMSYELIGGDHLGKIDEDAQKPVEGQLHVDTSAAVAPDFIPQQVTTPHGTFTLLATGHWTFLVDNAAVQGMAGAEIVRDSFMVQTVNGVQREVLIQLTGQDDATVIGGKLAGDVTEGGAGSVTGQMTFSDIDTPASKLSAFDNSYQGTYGSLQVNADGTWEYRLDPAKAHSLAAGDVKHEVFDQVFVDDGTANYPKTRIDITVHGTNDGATITGTDTGTLTEDSHVTAGKIATSGTLTVTDPDAGQDHFIAQAGTAGTYGSFSIDASGHWTYSADNSKPEIQQLKAGAPLTDSFTVTSADGTSHTVTMTITGSNDGPSVQSGDLGQTDQDQVRSFTEAELLRMVHAADVDTPLNQLHVDAVSVDASYGAFVKQGSDWVFTPAAGVHHDDIPVTVSVTDGHSTVSARATLDVVSTYTPPQIEIKVDVSTGQTATPHGSPTHDQLLDYFHLLSSGGSGRTISGSSQWDGSDSRNDMVHVMGDLRGELTLKSGNDVAFIEGRVSSEVQGDHGTDTVILGRYNSAQFRSISGHFQDVENIMTNDGVWVRGGGGMPPVVQPRHVYDLNLAIQDPNTGDSVRSITISGLPAGTELVYANGQQVPHDQHGGYQIDPARIDQVQLSSDHAITAGNLPALQAAVEIVDAQGQPHTEHATQSTHDEAVIEPDAEVIDLQFDVAPRSASEGAGSAAVADVQGEERLDLGFTVDDGQPAPESADLALGDGSHAQPMMDVQPGEGAMASHDQNTLAGQDTAQHGAGDAQALASDAADAQAHPGAAMPDLGDGSHAQPMMDVQPGEGGMASHDQITLAGQDTAQHGAGDMAAPASGTVDAQSPHPGETMPDLGDGSHAQPMMDVQPGEATMASHESPDSVLDHYLQFANSPETHAAGSADTGGDPTLAGYLAAAGVAPEALNHDTPPPVPEHVLLGTESVDQPTTPDGHVAGGEPAHAEVPADLPELQQPDDPQHHGV